MTGEDDSRGLSIPKTLIICSITYTSHILTWVLIIYNKYTVYESSVIDSNNTTTHDNNKMQVRK